MEKWRNEEMEIGRHSTCNQVCALTQRWIEFIDSIQCPFWPFECTFSLLSNLEEGEEEGEEGEEEEEAERKIERERERERESTRFFISPHHNGLCRWIKLLLTCCWINFARVAIAIASATSLGCALSPLQSNSFEHWSQSPFNWAPIEYARRRCVCAIFERAKRSRLDTWYSCLNEWVFLPAGV